MELYELSVKDLLAQFESGGASPSEAFRSVKDRIEKVECEVNAYLLLDLSGAAARAKAADDAWQQYRKGGAKPKALCGVPYALKDNMCVKGMRTTCASKILENFVPQYDATVAEKLAGSVLLGKANMDEFAMGSSNETSYFGPVKNPWNPALVPGGSSGGSAAAVAARLVPVATATDTGGSIRQPAALCGVTGIKPTYGRVSRYGMIAFASSLDQGGVIAATAEDAALVLNVIAGFDPRDSTSVDLPVPDYTATLAESVEGLRFGVIREFFDAGLEPAVERAVRDALAVYEKLGATLVDVDLPALPLSVPTYYVVAPAEASSNLARFDGVRFGYRCKDAVNLEDLYKRSRGEGFGAEVKRRIMTGTYVLSAGYYDAYYLKAQRVRQLIARDFARAFAEIDVLVGPTTPTPAFALGAKTSDPITMYLNDIYTIGANMAGLPALSIPCGFADELPVGLQLIGGHFSEARLLNVAHQYQLATDWHRRVPAGWAS